MTQVVETDLLEYLESLAPEDLLQWAWENHGDRAAITTSFQNTGCVMIDMSRKKETELRILTIDTLRLHPETYQLIDEIEQRYGTTIERYKPDEGTLQRMVAQHGEHLFFDSKAKQEYCCQVRKVDPNQQALATLDVWITGLRRDQSKAREKVRKAARVEPHGRPVLKLCPLVDWTEKQVEEYIQENQVSYNKLYDKGYTSIGCVICSTPTLPWEDKRAGRWRWFNQYHDDDKKECGIHIGGSGI